MGLNLAIVFASYRDENGEGVPVQRLRDHFNWNAEAYREFGNRLRVYVVTEVFHELPSCAECVIFPMEELPFIGGRRRFSITRTKNAGIRKAIRDGADVIVCTDVDIAFHSITLRELTEVDERTAAIPVYRMAPSFERIGSGDFDKGCTGTVSMTAANWKRCQYEEGCVGYGADDGILLRDIERAGLRINRSQIVAHVAHVQGDGHRIPGKGASTCWGRDTGFNFDNFHENRKLHRTSERRR